MEAISRHFPEEVVAEIMSWLPPRPMMRFKCVCRSWRSLIESLQEDPEFVSKHLRNANKLSSSRACFLFELCSLFRENQHYTLALTEPHDDDDDAEDEDEADDDADGAEDEDDDDVDDCIDGGDSDGRIPSDTMFLCLPPLMGSLEEGSGSLFGTFRLCNGVICILGSSTRLLLVNPALSDSVLQLKHSDEHSDVMCCGDEMGTGFGYDCRADDYKVVWIWRSSSDCIAKVFSLGTHSWKEIEMPFDEDSIVGLYSYAYCDGVCYWMTKSIDCVILSFDMCDEMFCCIELPDDLLREEWQWTEAHWRIELMVWNDSLALLFDTGPLGQDQTSQRDIQVWVLEEKGKGGGDCDGEGSKQWVHYLTIEDLDHTMDPLTIWNHDELLMKDLHGGEFFSYNLGSEEFREVDIDGTSEMYYRGTLVNSLVTVEGICKL